MKNSEIINDNIDQLKECPKCNYYTEGMPFSLEEIRDIVAKNRGYENWEILNGSDLYDSDIDEVARMYSESKTTQLEAEKAELLEALEDARIAIKRWDDELSYDIYDIIQKHKQ